jgi:hydrogenase expression/formation protein HypE
MTNRNHVDRVERGKENKKEVITTVHGAGGRKMNEFIKGHILPNFFPSNLKEMEKMEVDLEDLDDSAVVQGIAFTTDSYTVDPIFFPGGDIGRLAAAGTINDISVVGGKPLAMACSFLVEEGLEMEDFDKICRSLARTAEEGGVRVVTGDTKVLARGVLQRIMVNTSAIGLPSDALKKNEKILGKIERRIKGGWLRDSNLRPGDRIIVSGNIAEHGAALLAHRYGVDSRLKSDCAPLDGLMNVALTAGGVVAAKDPTRGGVSNSLNEWSEKSGAGILIREDDIPISEGARAITEMLGLDPLSIGNEGKAILGAVPQFADEVLNAIKLHPLGRDASIIGEVSSDFEGVVLETSLGTKRFVDWPLGDPVPRIC